MTSLTYSRSPSPTLWPPPSRAARPASVTSHMTSHRRLTAGFRRSPSCVTVFAPGTPFTSKHLPTVWHVPLLQAPPHRAILSAERQSFLPLGPGEAPILDVIRSFFGRGNRRRPRKKFSRPACARRGALGRARRGGRRGARIERLTANLWGPHSSKKERACFSACLFVWSVRVRIVCLLFCLLCGEPNTTKDIWCQRAKLPD